MRLRTTFVSSVPKDEQDPSHNDDSCAFSYEKQRWALSDGASESYNPSLWSKILVEQWLRHRAVFTPSKVQGAIARYEAECSCSELSWSKLAAYERGSYASFLGLALRNDTLEAVALGDTIVVLMDGLTEIKPFPYCRPEEFDQRPLLVATKPDHNQPLWTRAAWRQMRRKWRLGDFCDPHVLCMTDALGKLFLSSLATGSPPIEALLDINTVEGFEAFVRDARSSGKMRRDDTTLLVLDVEKK